MTREALKKLNEKQMNYCKTLSALIDRAKIKGLKEENERNRGSGLYRSLTPAGKVKVCTLRLIR